LEYFGDAVILCGGESRRMNMDKNFIKIDGRYMINIIYEKLSACFNNVKLCADSRDRLREFGMDVIEDIIKGRFGPAVGIYSALAQATTKYVFVIACDVPLVNTDHIEHMKRALAERAYAPDALVPVNGKYIEPLYSFYSVGMLKRFEEEIGRGNYKIHKILETRNVLYLEDKYSRLYDENLGMFTNINYERDLERFQ